MSSIQNSWPNLLPVLPPDDFLPDTRQTLRFSIWTLIRDAYPCSVTTPPAKPLVGVEPNPGPPRRKGAQKKKETSAKQTKKIKKSVTNPPVRQALIPHVRKDPKPRVSLNAYLRTLKDPWSMGPIRLGWGSFSQTGLHTAFSKFTVALPALDTCAAVVLNPLYYAAAAAINVNNGWCKTFSSPLGTTLLSAAITTNNLSAANEAYLQSVLQSNRLVSAAIRVVARYPATSTRGTMVGLQLPEESPSNIVGVSYNALIGLNASRWAISDSAGQIGVEVQYRPMDAESFNFNPGGLGSTTSTSQNLIVCLAGFPAGVGVTYECQCIAHYESISGLDSAGDDADNGLTLASSGVAMDMAGAEASRLPPVIPSISAMEMLDHALETAANSSSRTGMSLRNKGSYLSSLNGFNGLPGTVVQPLEHFGPPSKRYVLVD